MDNGQWTHFRGSILPISKYQIKRNFKIWSRIKKMWTDTQNDKLKTIEFRIWIELEAIPK